MGLHKCEYRRVGGDRTRNMVVDRVCREWNRAFDRGNENSFGDREECTVDTVLLDGVGKGNDGRREGYGNSKMERDWKSSWRWGLRVW